MEWVGFGGIADGVGVEYDKGGGGITLFFPAPFPLTLFTCSNTGFVTGTLSRIFSRMGTNVSRLCASTGPT